MQERGEGGCVVPLGSQNRKNHRMGAKDKTHPSKGVPSDLLPPAGSPGNIYHLSVRLSVMVYTDFLPDST